MPLLLPPEDELLEDELLLDPLGLPLLAPLLLPPELELELELDCSSGSVSSLPQAADVARAVRARTGQRTDRCIVSATVLRATGWRPGGQRGYVQSQSNQRSAFDTVVGVAQVPFSAAVLHSLVS